MRGYLLDTHVLLWWLMDDDESSTEARDVIRSGENLVYFSAAGAWEMAIKRNLGRLDYPGNLAEVLRESRIEVLSVTLTHALRVADLPLLHRDPFDRLQIAQAQLEGLTLVTSDSEIRRYDVPVHEA